MIRSVDELQTALDAGELKLPAITAAALAGDPGSHELLTGRLGRPPEPAADDLVEWVRSFEAVHPRSAVVAAIEAARIALDEISEDGDDVGVPDDIWQGAAPAQHLLHRLDNLLTRPNAKRRGELDATLSDFVDWLESIGHQAESVPLMALDLAATAACELLGTKSPEPAKAVDAAGSAVATLVETGDGKPEQLRPAMEQAVIRRALGDDEDSSEDAARPYSIKKRFEVDDRIDHPKFGIGVVVGVSANQVTVDFSGEVRKLVHGRP